MNKKLIGLLVPVLGGIAIVGSGFSAWQFSEKLSVDDTMNGVGKVTGVADAGTLVLNANKIYMTLDQKEAIKDNANYGKGSTGIIVTKLANVAGETETEVSGTTPSFTFTVDPVLAEDNIAGNMNYTGYKASVAFTDERLATYVNVSIANFGTNNEIGIDVEPVTANLVFTWVDGMKPTNMTEYTAMLNTIKDAGTATFTEETAKNGLSSFSFDIKVTVEAIGTVVAA